VGSKICEAGGAPSGPVCLAQTLLYLWPMVVWGWLLGVAIAGASRGSTPPEQDVRPGTALPPEQPTPEAARYEALLQNEPVLQGEDSVEKRRRFDDLRLGLGLGAANVSYWAAFSTEIDALDRVALGGEVGLSLWGLMAGGYARVRPVVWGGRGRRTLHALTLQLGYRYMQYGEDPYAGILSSACHGDCERVRFLSEPAHFVTLEAGVEHAFPSGWAIRYGLGAAVMANEPDWRCERAEAPSPCDADSAPARQLLLTKFVLTRAIF
jgi:hypothetical protein